MFMGLFKFVKTRTNGNRFGFYFFLLYVRRPRTFSRYSRYLHNPNYTTILQPQTLPNTIAARDYHAAIFIWFFGVIQSDIFKYIHSVFLSENANKKRYMQNNLRFIDFYSIFVTQYQPQQTHSNRISY